MKIEISISELLAGGKSEEEVVREILARDGGKQYTETSVKIAIKEFLAKNSTKVNIPGFSKWNQYKN